MNLGIRRHAAAILVIGLCGLAAYANTFNSSFHFDDMRNIVSNPLIQSAEFFFAPSRYCSGVGWENSEYPNCFYFKQRYVGYLTFAGNFFVHGLSVQGYHLVNIVIHLLNGMLVYLLVTLLFRTPVLGRPALSGYAMPLAVSTALLFVAHPLQTEAVTYIVQRFASLATMFYLLCVVSYIAARLAVSQRSRRFLYALAVISAVLAMKTKEIAFTCPLVVALLEFAFLEGALKKRLAFLVPLLLTMVIIPLGIAGHGASLRDLTSEMSFATTSQETGISRKDYFLTQFPVIMTYMRLIFLPVSQNADYDFPLYHSFLAPQVFLSFLALLAVAGICIYLFRRSLRGEPLLRVISVGIMWFFICLSVESSVIPIRDVIFEHRVYLPSIGAFLAIAASAAVLIGTYGHGSGLTVRPVVVGFSVLVLILTGLTFSRNMVWQDEFSFWQDVIQKSPGKARGYSNLGYNYMMEGESDRAFALLVKALALDPTTYEAYYNIGQIHEQRGEFGKAVESYTRAIEVSSSYPDIFNSRGNAYTALQEYDRAIADYSRAIALQPRNGNYYFNRGIARVRGRGYEEAIGDFSRSIALNSRSGGAYFQRGIATYILSKDFGRSLPDLEMACSLGYQMACDVLRSGTEQKR